MSHGHKEPPACHPAAGEASREKRLSASMRAHTRIKHTKAPASFISFECSEGWKLPFRKPARVSSTVQSCYTAELRGRDKWPQYELKFRVENKKTQNWKSAGSENSSQAVKACRVKEHTGEVIEGETWRWDKEAGSDCKPLFSLPNNPITTKIGSWLNIKTNRQTL